MTSVVANLFSMLGGLTQAFPMLGNRIVYSIMFPRVPVEDSDAEKIRSYNRIALRLGKRILNQEGYPTVFARGLWSGIKQAKAQPEHFGVDGLHLSDS